MLRAHATTNAAQNDYCDIHLTDFGYRYNFTHVNKSRGLCLKWPIHVYTAFNLMLRIVHSAFHLPLNEAMVCPLNLKANNIVVLFSLVC